MVFVYSVTSVCLFCLTMYISYEVLICSMDLALVILF